MVKSMTGYGRGEETAQGTTVTVELRAVNNRYLDCTVKMPRTYIFAEDALKELVQSKVSRGKVDVFVNVAHEGGDDVTVTVNESLARAYVRAMLQLERLGAEEGNRTILSDYKTADLARFPDVLTVEKKEEDQDQVKALLLAALDRALDDFNTMRAREGEKLKADILGRADTIESLTAKVEQRSPETVKEYRNRLEAKMQEVLQNTQIDESRLLTEAAIFADKVAVDEETVRLHSHLSQLRDMLRGDEPVGRKLDFLIQEINRECNTIGSKCSDLTITQDVVNMKAEVEKIREQVQNIE